VKKRVSRRAVIGSLVSTGLLAGCGRVDQTAPARALLDATERFTFRAQRLLLAERPLVRELSVADISAKFPTNGTILPKGDRYQRLMENGFQDWQLRVDGLVERPLALSLAQLRALPSRTQITMHNCDEGWSAIGQWTGVQLSRVLDMCAPRLNARYVVFHCMDTQEADGTPYYESIDLIDAIHPQTILAYAMNGAALPVGHGAPLRLRVELQIGYKNAKYVDRIELVDRLSTIGKGRGGWWEDFDRAPWYAGQ
jgi:DMSO/TMAO reductase YedYZ molybdopterin-dependent catalytic subunit